MRQAQKRKRGRKPRKKTEPLAEGIIPLNGHGHRDWRSLSDEEIVSFTKKMLEGKAITSRAGLKKADPGLYQTLRKRRLLGRIGIGNSRGDWASMSDEELIAYVRRYLEENGISGRSGLQKEAPGLYEALSKKGLLDKTGLESQRRDWKSLSDDEILDYSKRLIEEKGITNRKGLENADGSLCNVLRKRGLLDRLGLRKRKRRKHRDWVSMSDDEIVEHARKLVKKRKIKSRTQLGIEDKGLYNVLKRRRLVGRVIAESAHYRRRMWVSMSDDKLVDHARKYLRETGISRRNDLNNADRGLYSALRKRRLLDRVFRPIESDQRKQAIQDVVDAMEDFES